MTCFWRKYITFVAKFKYIIMYEQRYKSAKSGASRKETHQ